MKKFRIIFTCVLFWAAVSSYAQLTSSVVFTYDENGNRTAMEYVVARVYENVLTNDSTKTDVLDDMAILNISVYPNPTSGYLVLSANTHDVATEINARLFSFQGCLIEEKTITAKCTEFNLTGSPAGVYFLSIYYNDKKQIWKIIKK